MTTDVNDLIRRNNEIIDQKEPVRKEILDLAKAAEKENRGFTDDEMEKHVKMASEIEAFEKIQKPLQIQIEAMQAEEVKMKEFEADNPAVADYIANVGKKVDPTNREDYLEKFENFLRTDGGREQVNDLRSHSATSSFYNTSTVEGLECLIPEDWERNVIKQMQKESVLINLITKKRVSFRRGKFPVRGRVDMAAPRKSCEPYCLCKPEYKPKYVNIRGLGCVSSMCYEDLDDSMINFNAEFTEIFGKSVSRAMEHYGLLGARGKTDYLDIDGNAKVVDLTDNTPVGILNEITSINSKVSGGVTDQDIDEIMYSIPEEYRNNASFLTTDGIIKNLMQLRDGDGRPLWQPSLCAGECATIRGKRFYCSEFIPDVATGNEVMIYGDFKKIVAYMRKGFTMSRSSHVKFFTGEIAWRGDARYDIVTTLPEALVSLKIS